MSTVTWRTAFASALFWTLGVSARAVDEKQAPPAEVEKKRQMDKKPEMGKTVTGRKETRAIQEALEDRS